MQNFFHSKNANASNIPKMDIENPKSELKAPKIEQKKPWIEK